MSKLVVYVLDKFVWMLLVAVIATQALQIAGVVEGPKTLDQISYPQTEEYEFRVTAGDSREKRQVDRSDVIDNIFNIPISALQSVNELLQSTRRLRIAAVNNVQQNLQNRAPRKTSRPPERSYFDGPRVQADGSSSRVFLHV